MTSRPPLVTAQLLALTVLLTAGTARADATYQPIPFNENWGQTQRLNASDDWSQVPGIVGYLGENPFDSTPGRLARTILGDSLSPVDLIPNQTSPGTLSAGGVAEFHLTDPVVALQGSGTADCPQLVFHLDTTGHPLVTFACRLRDLDGSVDNAIQQIQVQYRPGPTGEWINVPGGDFKDVTQGPSLSGLETIVAVVLPGDAGNRPQLQVRVLTTNAVGNDEWVGIDDIAFAVATSGVPELPVLPTTWGGIKTLLGNPAGR